ncbi:hypothetical protein C9374_012403 [Naegleria lovaniensis]|uniref:Nucleoporin n=1 Tax=Naegleria lovaniensis TaxID=51637 RepID=A0AA88KQ53_NAELO|nr:uncharacterized protein C9374_012403 [Naegleria lovaniensis]KAG2392151.1 hypothetical protein C9374_012403 [Naegleria lovaniensis]
MWSKLSASSCRINPTTTTTSNDRHRRRPVGASSSSSSFLSKSTSQFLIITFLIIIGVFTNISFQQHTSSEANAPISLNRVSALIAWNSDGVTLKATTSGLSEDDKQNCFYWTTLHPELVTLVPVNKISDDHKVGGSQVMTCSQEIQVIPKGFHSKAQVAIVTAHRHHPSSGSSGATAFCEVFIDSISQVKLQTTVRKLTINELETLQVDGFDAEGNIFSSLTGLSFVWKSEGLSGHKKKGLIELIDINDESVHFFDEKKRIKRGVGSHDVIIAKGLQSGEVSVSVSLKSTQKEGVTLSDTVTISVTDSFMLKPKNEMRVVPGTVIPFELYIKKYSEKNQFELIPMPNRNYEWLSLNKAVGEIAPSTGVFKAIDLGSTNIMAQDVTFNLNKASALVHVVKPASIKILISPKKERLYRGYEYVLKNYKNANNDEHSSLVVNNEYEVKIELYDQYHMPILSRSKNEDLFLIRADQVGDVIFKASLNTGELTSGASFSAHENIELTQSRPISIVPPVTIQLQDSIIYLPHDFGVEQMFRIEATGGSGLLMWTAVNPGSSFDVVSQKGPGKVYGILTSKRNGEADVIVFDQQNLYNGDSRVVSVSQPHSLRFEKGVREVAVDDSLCLRLKALDSNGNIYHNISSLQFEWSITDTSVYTISSHSCQVGKSVYAEVSIRAIQEGFTTVKAKYQNGKLQEKTHVAVYPRLQITEPFTDNNKVFLVPLGATAQLTVSGGPQPWDSFVKKESRITDTIVAEEPDRLKIAKDTNTLENVKNRKRSFYITCLDFGKQQLSVEINHQIPTEDALPSAASIKVQYSCQQPAHLKVIPLNPSTMEELSLISKKNIRTYSVRNNQTIPAIMHVYDKEENQFITLSTLHDSWDLSNNNIVKFSPQQQAPGFRLLDINENEGTVVLTGKITGYKRDELKRHVSNAIISTAISSFSSPLVDEIELRIAPNVFITPTSFLLFRHRKVSLTVKASGGSGKYDFSHNNTHVADLVPKDSRAEVIGLIPGYVRVDVVDSYSRVSPAASCFVKVADAHDVALEGEHFVQVDRSISLKLRVFDDTGAPFPESQHFAMNPSIDIDTTRTVVIKQSDSSSDEYILTGERVGIVKLVASVLNSDGRRVFSAPFVVNVFEPMKVEPEELVLIPGANYQVYVSGGPAESQRVSTVFRFENSNVASVDQRGVVTGIAYGEETLIIEKKSTYSNVIYSRKTLSVYVVQLVGLKVPSPLTLFEYNFVPVPVYGVYTRGASQTKHLLSPVFMQSPYFKVAVDSQDSGVAFVNQPYSNTGHSVFISGKKVGKTQLDISAAFSGHPSLSSWHVQTSAIVQVDDKLKLIDFPHKDLILAPKSSTFRLKTNKDNISLQKYSIAKSDTYENVLSVAKNGEITTHTTEGISIVIIEEVATGQTVAQKVSVQNPHFLSMHLNQYGHTFGYDFKVQVDSDIEIPLSALSMRGEKFVSITGINLNSRMNYHDVVTIKVDAIREVLLVRANSVGVVTVELSSSELKEAYYCQFTVVASSRGASEKPVVSSLTLHVGDTIDLSNDWESDDSTVLSIDRYGHATAHQVGVVTLTSKGKASQIRVKIVTISSARIMLSKAEFSSSIDPSKTSPLRVPIRLFDDNQQIFDLPQDPRVRRNTIVECTSNIPWLDVIGTEKVGNHYECLVKPNRQSFVSGDLQKLSSGFQDLYFVIKVKYGEAAHDQLTLKTPSISAKFTSGKASEPSTSSRINESSPSQQEQEESSGYFGYIILSLIIGVLGFVIYGSMIGSSSSPRTFERGASPNRFVSSSGQRGSPVMMTQPQAQQSPYLSRQQREIPGSTSRTFRHSNSSGFHLTNSAFKASNPYYADPYYRDDDQE